MAKRSYQARPITAEWAERARAELRSRKGFGQRELAKTIGCAQTAISKTLSSIGSTSKLVEPISMALGLDLPALETLADDERQILDLLRGLSESGRAALIAHGMLVDKISEE
jgi:transcriptional regulator with XRE-family HTH domain